MSIFKKILIFAIVGLFYIELWATRPPTVSHADRIKAYQDKVAAQRAAKEAQKEQSIKSESYGITKVAKNVVKLNESQAQQKSARETASLINQENHNQESDENMWYDCWGTPFYFSTPEKKVKVSQK